MAETLAVLTGDPLEPERFRAFVAEDGRGAHALFVGVVRSPHEGREVEAVEYEAFEPLAGAELGRIVEEAASRWGARVAAGHRLGRLAVGEASLVVAAAAPHRGEAFESCRWVVEEVKRRVPIFKREIYADGRAAWLEGRALGSRSP